MSSRKAFLAASALFALTPAAAGAAVSAPKPSSTAQPKLTFDFDRARFEQILAKPAAHKQCFGATSIEDGTVLYNMSNSIDAYQTYLGEAPGSLHAVSVLYHGAAIALVMSDTVWNEYLIPTLGHAPEHIRKDIGGAKRGKGNPYLRSASKDAVSVESLVASGASFFVCHNALAGFAGIVADALKEPPERIHAALIKGIVPGGLLVPAGVMAVNACQEAKFTYIQSTL